MKSKVTCVVLFLHQIMKPIEVLQEPAEQYWFPHEFEIELFCKIPQNIDLKHYCKVYPSSKIINFYFRSV